MRLLFVVALCFCVGAIGTVGCGKPKTTAPKETDTKKGGGDDKDKGSISITKIDDFELEANKENEVKLTIDRAKFAEGNVDFTITVAKAEGVTVDPAKVTIKGKEKDATFTVKTAKDAKAGTAEISLKGKNDKMKDA